MRNDRLRSPDSESDSSNGAGCYVYHPWYHMVVLAVRHVGEPVATPPPTTLPSSGLTWGPGLTVSAQAPAPRPGRAAAERAGAAQDQRERALRWGRVSSQCEGLGLSPVERPGVGRWRSGISTLLYSNAND